MKTKQIIVLFFLYFSCPAQKKGKDFVCFSLGSIKHQVSTKSLTGKIVGLPTFDVLPELYFIHEFSEHHLIKFGIQNPSLSVKCKINQDSPTEPNEGSFRSLTSNSGYLDFYLIYSYKIILTEKCNFNFGMGPYLIYSKVKGLDDYGGYTNVNTTSTNTFIYSVFYEVNKIKRFGSGAMLCLSFEINRKKNRKMIFNFGYHKGLINFSEFQVTSNIQNQFNDQATVYSNGSGFFASVGFGIPIFNKIDKESN